MNDDYNIDYHNFKDFDPSIGNILDDPFFDINDLSSAHECTGLIPGKDTNEAEAQFHSELYGIHKQKVDD